VLGKVTTPAVAFGAGVWLADHPTALAVLEQTWDHADVVAATAVGAATGGVKVAREWKGHPRLAKIGGRAARIEDFANNHELENSR